METKNLVTYSNENSMLMNPDKFEHVQRVGKMLASSDLIPDQFRGKMANCVIALNLAYRMQLDPFMVMQKMYVVHGKPGIESQLAIAVFNKSGNFKPIIWEEGGTGKDQYAIAVSEDLRSGTVIKSTKVTLKMADDEGWSLPKGTMKSKWVTMPDVMLRYRSAMFLIKQYAPETILGMQSSEEIIDVNTGKTRINVDFQDITNSDEKPTTEEIPEEKEEEQKITQEPSNNSEQIKPKSNVKIGYSEKTPEKQFPPGILALQDQIIEKLDFMVKNRIDGYEFQDVREITLKRLLSFKTVRENDAKMDLERCNEFFQKIINDWKKRTGVK